MLAVVFTLLVVFGFMMWFLATFPVPWAERAARGLFLLAAIFWAVSQYGPGLHSGAS